MSPGGVTFALASRLEKAATDNGFDLPRPPWEEWLSFASTHAPLRIWLTADAEGRPLAALSREDVAEALGDLAAPASAQLPAGAVAALAVRDVAALHRLLRRAHQLASTLPDELLHRFEKKVAGLPRATEAERLVVQRVGQDVFRAGLMDYWEGRCAVTGLAVPELLRASHIKPWAACGTDAERLDVYNGLLLAAHLDATFDAGLMTVADDGQVLLSPHLSVEARRCLGFTDAMRVKALGPGHRSYLAWHREREFMA